MGTSRGGQPENIGISDKNNKHTCIYKIIFINDLPKMIETVNGPQVFVYETGIVR
jgi:hypothetical protein